MLIKQISPMAAFRSLQSFFLVLLSSGLFTVNTADAGLKIYYIRHAEGGHNVKADWANVPQDQWPAYVGNQDVFTPLGLKQQAAVEEKLKPYKFDFIAVSPMWRCRNTILPYLKKTGTKGEIWPELRELRAGVLILSKDLPTPKDPILGAGRPVELPAEESTWFSLRKDGLKGIKVPPTGDGKAADERSAAAARVVIQRVLKMIQNRFGGSETTILLSGHGSSGKAVARMLTQNPLKGFPGISNTGIWMVEEQPNGKFELLMYNDAPVKDGKLVLPPSQLPAKFASIDTDHDGIVTKQQFVKRYTDGFDRKDKNDDKFLSPDEHDHSSFEKADKNKDNQLTREEYSTIFERQFDNTYDKNKDGVITVLDRD